VGKATAITESAASPAATEQPLEAATAAAVACATPTVRGQTRLEAFTQDHLQRLERIFTERDRPAVHDLQRGLAAQQVFRELERSIRRGVLDFCRQATAQGLSQQEQSAWLTLSPRTLRHWERAWQNGGLAVKARGRPLLCADQDEQQQVVHFLHRLGPGTGLAVLQGEFPEVARAELQDLLRCFRWAWVGEHSPLWHQLHWRGPGRVWAMDYAEAPCWIDGCYRYVLAVRDLASGQQLLWLPLAAATAATTMAQLALLFALYGPPLVLKSDNGSPFSAEDTREFLHGHGVWPLFSPPRTPSYNGSCEAAIGAMKKRTEYQAERHGHAGGWTSTDLQTARQQANDTARPRGPKGPTPAEAWQQRTAIAAAERRLFADAVDRLQGEVRRQHELPQDQELAHRQEAEVQREVLRRALVAHGYLFFTRRRIPIPIRRLKAAKNR
jgi:transposase InsO family protein